MQRVIFVLSLMLLVFPELATSQPLNQDFQQNPIQYRTPKALFNGKNLKGWYTFL
jgi:hypothetical protein